MRIGIDLGGTKIEIAAINDSGEIIKRARTNTPKGDYAGTLDAITELVFMVESEFSIKATIGVAIPGTTSKKTGLIKNANSTWLIGKNLKDDLTERLNRPVKLANDANCFTLSEAADGAASNHTVVFGVILGTGVGGGIAINRTILPGINSIAGEWGHNPLPWPNKSELLGEKCYCKLNGCIETYLSGPALASQYKLATGKSLLATEIAVLADNGDEAAGVIMGIYENRLARALAHLINILDPDAIVFGGGLSNIDRLYKNVPKQWLQYIFSDSCDTVLLKHHHGDSSGVRGAAWLWGKDELGK